MMTLRPSKERGYADHGWLQSFHSFSFAGYYDPKHMGWGNLRVINEDWIAAGKGFGSLAHKDSMGNVKAIPPGDVQRMSAGTGVQHSEFNHAPNDTTHLLQIWIEPNVLSVSPSYEQKSFSAAEKQGVLRLVASPDGAQGSVTIHADASLYAGLFDAGQTADLPLRPGRKAYVHLVRGTLMVNGMALTAGDAALLNDETAVRISQAQAAEVLVFDLSA